MKLGDNAVLPLRRLRRASPQKLLAQSCTGGFGGRFAPDAVNKKENRDGLLVQRVPVPVLADLPRPVLLERATLSQPAAAGRQLHLLRLVAGRLPRPVRRRNPELDRPNACAGGVRRRQRSGVDRDSSATAYQLRQHAQRDHLLVRPGSPSARAGCRSVSRSTSSSRSATSSTCTAATPRPPAT